MLSSRAPLEEVDVEAFDHQLAVLVHKPRNELNNADRAVLRRAILRDLEFGRDRVIEQIQGAKKALTRTTVFEQERSGGPAAVRAGFSGRLVASSSI